MAEFNGDSVVVMGAGGALGGAVATAFTAAGASVLGVDRGIPAPEHQVPSVNYHAVDVLDDAALGNWFSQVSVPWAVVNVVGGFAAGSPMTEFDPAQLADQLRLNLTSAALITKYALRRMEPAGQGRIVHTASRAALDTDGAGFAYSVSKLGVLHLVTMAARQTHGSGITVNAVVPSIMDTPANRSAMPKAEHDRWPKLDEVAAVYVFLASKRSQLVSGAAVPVYGLS